MLHSLRPGRDRPAASGSSPSTGSPGEHLGTNRPVGSVRRRLRGAAIVSVLGSFGLLLAACSSGTPSAANSSSTSTTSTGSGSASFAAYASCLKSHGANFTGGGGFGGGGFGGGSGGPPSSGSTTRPTISASERATFEKAATACASLRPKFGGGNSTAFDAYRNCLKLHGVTLPTGRGAGGFPGAGGTSGTSTSTTFNAKYQAAMTACASLRPKGGFGGGGGGFPGSSTTTTG
jgi:hypothetical protein